MRTHWLAFPLLLTLGCASRSPPAGNGDYPPSPARPVTETLHGVKLTDPWRWLEDGKAPGVRTWMGQQDARARKLLHGIPGRDAIARRLAQLAHHDELSPPFRRGNRFFFMRRAAGQEMWVAYWREGRDGKDQILLDPNTWSKDKSKTLGNWSTSWDGRTAAYTVHVNNADRAVMHVMDVETGKVSEVDDISDARFAGAAWTADNKAFYYGWTPDDPAIPEQDLAGKVEVRLHVVGTRAATDAVILPATGDPTVFFGVDATRDGHYLIQIRTDTGATYTHVLVKDLRVKDGAFVPLFVDPRANGMVDEFHDEFFLTADDVPHGHVFRIQGADPERSHWKEVIPERLDAHLEGASVVGGRLAVDYLKDAVVHSELRNLDGTLMRALQSPGLASTDIAAGDPEDDEAFVAVSSFTRPVEFLMTSVEKGGLVPFFSPTVDVDPEQYLASQTFYTSKDGTRVPMFIIHRKDLVRDGTAPTWLTAYGGFSDSITPHFLGSLIPWMDHGGVVAMPNLRGGGEYGKAWHEAGMLHTKQNTFDDFIAAAEFLIANNYTQPRYLAIEGASNGGLLVGAVMVQRPELFGVVLCGVPLLDMVRYTRVGQGKTWMPEYGDPDNAEDFAALHAYSPYHHVKAGTRYPALLIASADSDDRVDPMHARKFAAAVQQASTGGPVLLRVERNSGHGGAGNLTAAIEEEADMMAFALSQMGHLP